MAVGLRFLGVGDTVSGLADVYSLLDVSFWRCINMFLDTIDYKETCPELQVRLPDPKNAAELVNLSARWCATSTAYGLFQHNLGCLDGWLHFTVALDASNQADYYSGHYQSQGLNVQAMCDPDLLFLFVAVAAPGKVNNLRAFNLCSNLRAWCDVLPDEYFDPLWHPRDGRHSGQYSKILSDFQLLFVPTSNAS